MRLALPSLVVLGLLAASPALAQDEPAPPQDEPGPGAPPPPGTAEDADPEMPLADRDPEAPPADAKPKGSDTPPTGSVVISFQGEVPQLGETVASQEDVAGKKFVTLTGTATCKGCEGSLVLMVEHRSDESDEERVGVITTKPLAEAGSFELLVPKIDTPVLLYLLVDKNSSGGPDRGEHAALLDLGGKLVPSEDRSGLALDATVQD